jgi:hypothetical protein
VLGRLEQSADDLAELTEEQETTVERLRHEFTDRSGPIPPQSGRTRTLPKAKQSMR